MGSRQVMETLSEVMVWRGIPEHIRSDNGPEFISQELRLSPRGARGVPPTRTPAVLEDLLGRANPAQGVLRVGSDSIDPIPRSYRPDLTVGTGIAFSPLNGF